MIQDHIDNAGQYYGMHPRFQQAFEALKEMMTQPELTGRVEVDGEHLFCLVNAYSTNPLEEQQMEAHRKYLDIQLMVDGSEQIGIAFKDGRPESKAFDAQSDYALFGADCQQFISLKAGQFAIFYPQDLHMPGLDDGSKQTIRKLVMKVAIDTKP